MIYRNAIISSEYILNNLKYPLIVFLKITSKCMLNCKFCSQFPRDSSDMDIEFAKHILEDLKKNGTVTIFYTGGEPLLYKNLVELLKYGYELGFNQIIVTNGMLLCDDELKEIYKYITSISVSLHGKENIHDLLVCHKGCFKKVIKNIKYVKNNYSNVKIDILCTAVNENINVENINYLANYCSRNNFNLSLSRVNYIGKGENYYDNINIDKLFEIVDSLVAKGFKINVGNCVASCTVDERYDYLTKGCDAGVLSCAIETNGDVKICATSKEVIGNIYQHSLRKIWNCKRLTKMRKIKFLPAPCQSCNKFEKCRGGCKSEFGKLGLEICDGLVLKKHAYIWNEVKNKHLKLRIGKVIRLKKQYMIVGEKIRIIDNFGYKILYLISEKNTPLEILKEFAKDGVREFIIALYLDGFTSIER